MNDLYPIFIKLSGKKCVVIGGGKIAFRKVKALLAAHAQVKIISIDFCPELGAMIEEQGLDATKRAFQKGDLDDAFLAIAATNDPAANQQIWDEANQKNILVNIVDVPELCNFYVPSVVRDGDLALAISTNGKAPYVSKKLRIYLEKLLRKLSLKDLIQSVDQKKQSLKQSLPDDIKEREKQIKEFTNNLFNKL